MSWFFPPPLQNGHRKIHNRLNAHLEQQISQMDAYFPFFVFFLILLYTTRFTLNLILRQVINTALRCLLKSASHLVLIPRAQIGNLVELRCADATDRDHNVGIWHLSVACAV